MRLLKTMTVLTTALLIAASGPALAHGGRGGHWGGGFHGGGGHWGGYHSGARIGVFIGAPVWRPAYYPPYYYPPVYARPAPPSYWYYCASSGAYYPYVPYCPEGWQAVLR